MILWREKPASVGYVTGTFHDCFEEGHELFGSENRRQLRRLLAENDPLNASF
jgi:hypothetical protein